MCAGGWTDRDRTNMYDGCVVDRDANHDTNHGHAVYVEAVELGKVESRVGGVSGEAGVMWGDGVGGGEEGRRRRSRGRRLERSFFTARVVGVGVVVGTTPFGFCLGLVVVAAPSFRLARTFGTSGRT